LNDADVTQNFDYVFWSGDLNFRLATPRSKVLEWLSKTSFPLPDHLPHGYLHHDQLCSVLADGAAFKGFTEAKITFPPTYKVSCSDSKQTSLQYCFQYDPGTQNFDSSSKQRTPAYTDRILYKQRAGRRFSGQFETPPLQCLVYDSVSSITTSDHKPVWGVFKAPLRPGLDTSVFRLCFVVRLLCGKLQDSSSGGFVPSRRLSGRFETQSDHERL
jgi:hypothetical protein